MHHLSGEVEVLDRRGNAGASNGTSRKGSSTGCSAHAGCAEVGLRCGSQWKPAAPAICKMPVRLHLVHISAIHLIDADRQIEVSPVSLQLTG